MYLENSIDEKEPCILVEGPNWANADFYGRWLQAAAKADAIWKRAIKDSSFENEVARLLVVSIPDFSIGATVLLSRLEKNLASFTIHLNGEEDVELVDEFVLMAEMGFFVLTGQRYQMVIPTRLNMDKVKRAALKFAQTEDEDCYLHPEHLVATMPYAEAAAWQHRLRDMDEAHRQADRLLLLEVCQNSRDNDFCIFRRSAWS
jgi:hypothetical protein